MNMVEYTNTLLQNMANSVTTDDLDFEDEDEDDDDDYMDIDFEDRNEDLPDNGDEKDGVEYNEEEYQAFVKKLYREE